MSNVNPTYGLYHVGNGVYVVTGGYRTCYGCGKALREGEQVERVIDFTTGGLNRYAWQPIHVGCKTLHSKRYRKAFREQFPPQPARYGAVPD